MKSPKLKIKRFNGVNLRIVLLVFVSALFESCANYTPKPHGYPRTDFPARSYQIFDDAAPFSFEIPSYAIMERDTDSNTESHWYNMLLPQFDATVHMSYKHFSKSNMLDSLTEDAYRLAMKHTVKAEDIRESEFRDTSTGTYGILYDFYGRTATPFNFYITDEKNHFIRGAFYFNQNANSDSVMPIFKFLKKDLSHLISTVEWKTE